MGYVLMVRFPWCLKIGRLCTPNHIDHSGILWPHVQWVNTKIWHQGPVCWCNGCTRQIHRKTDCSDEQQKVFKAVDDKSWWCRYGRIPLCVSKSDSWRTEEYPSCTILATLLDGYWVESKCTRNRINIKVTQKCGSFPLEIIWAIWPSKFTDEEWFKMLVPSVFDAYVWTIHVSSHV